MTFDDYQKQALTTAINHPNPDYVFFDRVLSLVGEAGEVAEKVKKWIRDDKADFSKLDKQDLANELGDVLWYVATIADFLDYKFDTIAQENLKKLASRKTRGRLTGSGDTR